MLNDIRDWKERARAAKAAGEKMPRNGHAGGSLAQTQLQFQP
jgi:hypothetical protein